MSHREIAQLASAAWFRFAAEVPDLTRELETGYPLYALDEITDADDQYAHDQKTLKVKRHAEYLQGELAKATALKRNLWARCSSTDRVLRQKEAEYERLRYEGGALVDPDLDPEIFNGTVEEHEGAISRVRNRMFDLRHTLYGLHREHADAFANESMLRSALLWARTLWRAQGGRKTKRRRRLYIDR